MLSPLMLKSTNLTRRQTLSPKRQRRRKTADVDCDQQLEDCEAARNHNHARRGSAVMIYVEEGHQREEQAVEEEEQNHKLWDSNQRRMSRIHLSPHPSPPPQSPPAPVKASGLAGSKPPNRPRNSIGEFSFTDSYGNSSGSRRHDSVADELKMMSSREAKLLQRRKTSTAASLIRKLKIPSSGKSAGSQAEKDGCKIEVHHYSNDPTIAWEMLKTKYPVKVVKPMSLDTPLRQDFVRFVCLANTNGAKLDSLFVPDGDVLLVAGNFTRAGHPAEIKEFNKFLGTLPHKYKVVIAGSHELTFDNAWQPTSSVFSGLEKLFKSPVVDRASFIRDVLQTALAQERVSDPRDLLTNCLYLEDDSVVLYGLRIYGSPWLPLFDNLAFNLPRGHKLLDKWNLIPAGVDVLITQTAPLGYGDLCQDGHRAGCVELLTSLRRRIHAKYHVFGGVVESYGCTTDGYTKYINASIVQKHGRGINQPVIFDIAMPNEEEQY